MTLVTVRVQPGASRNEIAERDGQLVVRVTAQPADGKANKAVVKLLAKHFGVPPTSIEIVRGHTRRDKLVRVG